jgi:hypothetical protein
MATVYVHRFSEEEFRDENGVPELSVTGARLIARCDSAESAVKLLGVSGMRPLDAERHPFVAKMLEEASERLNLPLGARVYLRGVHGTFVVTRTGTSKRVVYHTSATEDSTPVVKSPSGERERRAAAAHDAFRDC